MGLSSRNSEGIKAELILEVLGRPAEHLVETLNRIIDEIDKEKGVKVLRKKVNEPRELKDKQEGFYTTFAEIEVEVEEVLYLAMLMFKYMPAHIEVVSPEAIVLTSNGWNEILNELTRRLHGYDEVARVLQIEKTVLERKLRELLGQNKKEMNPQTPAVSEKKSDSNPKSKKNKK